MKKISPQNLIWLVILINAVPTAIVLYSSPESIFVDSAKQILIEHFFYEENSFNKLGKLHQYTPLLDLTHLLISFITIPIFFICSGYEWKDLPEGDNTTIKYIGACLMFVLPILFWFFLYTPDEVVYGTSAYDLIIESKWGYVFYGSGIIALFQRSCAMLLKLFYYYALQRRHNKEEAESI